MKHIKIFEEFERVEIHINENNIQYLKWKRENVTLRGINNDSGVNNIYGSFGKGLYTTQLSNISFAKKYGELRYVVNAKPKNPKIVATLNDAQLWIQKIINDYCKVNNQEYNVKFFDEHTSIEKEMLNLGFDGLFIKGREMVNYTPKNIVYFKTEEQLKNYFDTLNLLQIS